MPKKKHNPKTSSAFVVRYLKADPGKHRIVKKVKGQAEAIKWVDTLSKAEKQPKKYAHLWRWEDPQAALEYDLEHLNPVP